jgi:protein TonB
MEAKKTSRADLQNRRIIFLEIGLVVALLVVVGAFAWSQKELVVTAMDIEAAIPEEEIIINTEQEQRQPEIKPQPVQAISDFIEVVRDDAKIETTMTFTDFDENVQIQVPTVVEEVVEDVPELNPDEAPIPPGGDINTFRNWLFKALVYPRVAIENNITGTVTLKFVVERDGSVSGIEAMASPDKSLTEEAIRALKTSPKWQPGKTRNRPVRSFFILPVQFTLQQ